MLSRLALRSVADLRPLALVARTSTTAAQSETRDEVNFPRPERLIYPGKVRLGFIPEEWFQFLYPKTGVTGPYVFGISFLTYLYSKEILVMEHEFYSGISLAFMIVFAIKKFGPSVAASLDKEVDAIEESYKNYRNGSIQTIKDGIEGEKKSQWQADGQTLLFDAKKENIGLQLEAAYRERLAEAHKEVKRKLDYQLETANVKTRIEQKHMVDWIVKSVTSSITPDQEAAALKQCLTNLKGLVKA